MLTQVAEFQALQSVYSEAGAVEMDCEGLLQQVQQVHSLPTNPLLSLPFYRWTVHVQETNAPNILPVFTLVYCIVFKVLSTQQISRAYTREAQMLESEAGTGVIAPQLSGRVRLTDVAAPGGEPLSLHFSLPRGYPCSAGPVLRVLPFLDKKLAHTVLSCRVVSPTLSSPTCLPHPTVC